MDRDHELAQNYSDISRATKEVEGEWYLCEMEGRMPWVISTYNLAESLKNQESIRKEGWFLTPVSIFRKT